MSRNSLHVVPIHRGRWSVRKAGAARARVVFKTRYDAVAFARKLARKDGSELYVHAQDGTVKQKDTYGPDPYPPNG